MTLENQQNDQAPVAIVTAPVAAASNFEQFNLPAKLLQSLNRMNFTTPTPVQLQTLPLALDGRDVLGSAQTGTGKTGAFGIPVIAKLMANPQSAALILTPTRELATQVMAALQAMNPSPDIKGALLIGGEAMPRQFNQLKNRPRLIVGTPGRINDHLDRGTLKLNNVHFLVMDETDRMLDMGFGIQIDRIMQHVPEERQTLLFSATLPHNIVKLSSKYLNNPARIAVGSTTTPAAKIQQDLVHTSESEKYPELLEQLTKREGTVIIFVKTKFGTERLAARLNRDGHTSEAIHGDLQQRKRERVIRSFRDQEYRVLVATDVAARGLDIPHIAHVVNYDLPQCPEDYIHRIGRTARAGAEGAAVNLLTPADGAKWRAIHRLMHGSSSDERGDSKGSNGGGGQRGRGGPSFGKSNSFGARKPRPFGGGGGGYDRNDRGGERSFDAPRGHSNGPSRRYDNGPSQDRGPSRFRDDNNSGYAPRRASDDGQRPYAPRSNAGGGYRPHTPRSDDRPDRGYERRSSGGGYDRGNSDRPASSRPQGERFGQRSSYGDRDNRGAAPSRGFSSPKPYRKRDAA